MHERRDGVVVRQDRQRLYQLAQAPVVPAAHQTLPGGVGNVTSRSEFTELFVTVADMFPNMNVTIFLINLLESLF